MEVLMKKIQYLVLLSIVALFDLHQNYGTWPATYVPQIYDYSDSTIPPVSTRSSSPVTQARLLSDLTNALNNYEGETVNQIVAHPSFLELVPESNILKSSLMRFNFAGGLDQERMEILDYCLQEHNRLPDFVEEIPTQWLPSLHRSFPEEATETVAQRS